MTRGRLASRGIPLAGVCVVLTATAVVGIWRRDDTALTAFSAVALVVLGLGCVASGFVVVDNRPRSRVGWLLTVGGVLLLAAAASWWASARAVESLGVVGAMVVLPLAALLVPDEALPRVVGPVGAVAVIGCGVAALSYPDGDSVVATSGLIVVLVVALVLWVRFERGNEADRTAVLWLALASTATLMVGGHILFVAPNPVMMTVAMVICLTIPASMAVGVLRPELADIRQLFVRWVVFLVAALLLISFFSAAVDVVTLVNDREPGTGATALIALLVAVGFQPTRVALQGVVDRVLFGDRADPVTAASHVGARLSDDPVVALRALRESLAFPYAALTSRGEVIASSGTATTRTSTVELTVGTDVIGALVVALRPGELRLATRDLTVLQIVAPALAQAMHARGLTRELLESRSAVIAVVEEERRRLRRDLHDGLGPTLTGVAYAADAARNLMTVDPNRADALLARLRTDTADAILEIRRLVEGLRPPALDELGLVEALRQQTARMFGAEGQPLTVVVSAPEGLPHLPAAVEVAAYRIVTEAVTNVAKHAACERADVLLGVVGHDLTIEVADTGTRGGDAPERTWTAGVGLASMQERAHQLGGTCIARATAAGGRVTATLPLGELAAG